MERRISVVPFRKEELIEGIVFYQTELIKLEVLMGKVKEEASEEYLNTFRERLNNLSISSLKKYYQLIEKIYREKLDEYHNNKIKLEEELYNQFLDDYLKSLSPEIAELVEKYENEKPYHTGNLPIPNFPVYPIVRPKEEGLGLSPFKPGYRDMSSNDNSLSSEYRTILSNYIPLVDSGKRNAPSVASEYELYNMNPATLGKNELIQLNMSLYSELINRTSFNIGTIVDSSVITKFNELVLKLSRDELTKLFKKLSNIERNTRLEITCSCASDDFSLSMSK